MPGSSAWDGINVPTRVQGLVNAILSVYRGERFVASAIESVPAQTCRVFELVIVNDGSRDKSARTIQGFLPHPQSRYVEPIRFLDDSPWLRRRVVWYVYRASTMFAAASRRRAKLR